MATPTPATTRPTPEPRLGEKACPHCDCWMTNQRVDYADKLREMYCLNCGQFTAVPPGDKLPAEQCCKAGKVVHTHSTT